MSASQKSTGGTTSKASKAPSAERSARGSTRSKARVELESAPRSTLDSASSIGRSGTRSPSQRRSRRAKAIRAAGEGIASSRRPPQSPSTSSSRPQIVEAARSLAQEHGYEQLRVRQITERVGISHQAFYGHFANKRHALAFATSEELGAIVDLAIGALKKDQAWAKRLLEDVDKALVEIYPAKDGPEVWLRELLTEAICSEGGYESLRIAEMIKISRLGHGEFYRRYGGKRGCLRRIYSEAVEELIAEVEQIGPGSPAASLRSIGERLAADPGRARLLIVTASQLPPRTGPDERQDGFAVASSLAEAIESLLCERNSLEPGSERSRAVVGAALELCRTAILGDRMQTLPTVLGDVGETICADTETPAVVKAALVERQAA